VLEETQDVFIRAGPHRRATRKPMIRCSVRVGSWAGHRFGRLERSPIPTRPCSR